MTFRRKPLPPLPLRFHNKSLSDLLLPIAALFATSSSFSSLCLRANVPLTAVPGETGLSFFLSLQRAFEQALHSSGWMGMFHLSVGSNQLLSREGHLVSFLPSPHPASHREGKGGSLASGLRVLPIPGQQRRGGCSVLLSLLRWAEAATTAGQCKKPGLRERECQAAGPQPLEGKPSKDMEGPSEKASLHFGFPPPCSPEFCLSVSAIWGQAGVGQSRKLFSKPEKDTLWAPSLVESSSSPLRESHRLHDSKSSDTPGDIIQKLLGRCIPCPSLAKGLL